MPQAGAADWQMRLRNSFALQDYADAAQAATNLAQHWPDQLALFDDRVYSTIVTETQRNPQTAALAAGLRAALDAAHRRSAGGS